jgi:hypothetical protein
MQSEKPETKQQNNQSCFPKTADRLEEGGVPIATPSLVPKVGDSWCGFGHMLAIICSQQIRLLPCELKRWYLA